MKNALMKKGRVHQSGPPSEEKNLLMPQPKISTIMDEEDYTARTPKVISDDEEVEEMVCIGTSTAKKYKMSSQIIEE